VFFASAICFESFLLSVVGLTTLLGARTFASIMTVVLAGAVFTLFIFVISYTDKKKARERKMRYAAVIASVASFYLFLILGLSVLKPPFLNVPLSGEMYESPLRMGEILFAKFLIPFELIGLVFILIAAAACMFSSEKSLRG